jgi:hypothetical protein
MQVFFYCEAYLYMYSGPRLRFRARGFVPGPRLRSGPEASFPGPRLPSGPEASSEAGSDEPAEAAEAEDTSSPSNRQTHCDVNFLFYFFRQNPVKKIVKKP